MTCVPFTTSFRSRRYGASLEHCRKRQRLFLPDYFAFWRQELRKNDDFRGPEVPFLRNFASQMCPGASMWPRGGPKSEKGWILGPSWRPGAPYLSNFSHLGPENEGFLGVWYCW